MKGNSFKLCIVISLLGVYIAIVGLTTLTFFKVTGVSEILTANCVEILVLCSLNVAWLLHT